MIQATESDLGRSVVYRPAESKVEEGVITSISKLAPYVFVRYGKDKGSKATHCSLLEWSQT